MKQIIFVCIMLACFTACTSGLSHTQAEELISRTLEIPKSVVHKVKKEKRMCWGSDIQHFMDAGLVTASATRGEAAIYLTVTKAGKPWYLGQNSEEHLFKAYRIVFESITGIAMDASNTTATVRFTLRATDITPFARCLRKEPGPCNTGPAIEFDLDQPIKGELFFRRFDNGWQLDEDTSMKNVKELKKRIQIRTFG